MDLSLPMNREGSIDIISLEDVFKRSWEGRVYFEFQDEAAPFLFDGKEYGTRAFGKLIRPFDLYSDYECAAFLLVDDHQFQVMMLSDHYVEWDASKLTNFETYLELALKTKGSLSLRRQLMMKSEGGHTVVLSADDLQEHPRPFPDYWLTGSG